MQYGGKQEGLPRLSKASAFQLLLLKRLRATPSPFTNFCVKPHRGLRYNSEIQKWLETQNGRHQVQIMRFPCIFYAKNLIARESSAIIIVFL